MQMYTATIRFLEHGVDIKLVKASSAFEACEVVKSKLVKEGRSHPADIEIKVFEPLVEG